MRFFKKIHFAQFFFNHEKTTKIFELITKNDKKFRIGYSPPKKIITKNKLRLG
jgi:hypothetical protein